MPQRVPELSDSRIMLHFQNAKKKQLFLRDLKKILIQTEMLCGSGKRQKETIREIIAQIKVDMDLLFVDSGFIRRTEALILIEKIHQELLSIQEMCHGELTKPGPERKSWRRNLNRALSATKISKGELFDINKHAITKGR